MSKTAKAIAYFVEGRYKEAFGIFRTFSLSFSKDDKRTIQIASEMLNGYGDFYRQVGIETDIVVEKAKTIIRKRYML